MRPIELNKCNYYLNMQEKVIEIKFPTCPRKEGDQSQTIGCCHVIEIKLDKYRWIKKKLATRRFNHAIKIIAFSPEDVSMTSTSTWVSIICFEGIILSVVFQYRRKIINKTRENAKCQTWFVWKNQHQLTLFIRSFILLPMFVKHPKHSISVKLEKLKTRMIWKRK